MEVSRDEIKDYLNEVKKYVNDGKYQISQRTKNLSLYIDYVFSEERCKEVILDLDVDDFSDAVQNDHPQYPEEILYIFGKEVSLLPKQGGSAETVALYIKFNKLTNSYVIVVSFHKQDYPLTYRFK